MSADIWLDADCCAAHDHNITHNLGEMFREAGVDWHEYEGQDRTAAHLLADIVGALRAMSRDDDRFRAMNPPNGWGTYEGAVTFLAGLAADCLVHPEAIVRVSL